MRSSDSNNAELAEVVVVYNSSGSGSNSSSSSSHGSSSSHNGSSGCDRNYNSASGSTNISSIKSSYICSGAEVSGSSIGSGIHSAIYRGVSRN